MKTGIASIDTAADNLIEALKAQYPDQADRIGRAGITLQFDNAGFIQVRTMELESPATPAAADPKVDAMPAPAPAAMEAPGAAVLDVATGDAAAEIPAVP